MKYIEDPEDDLNVDGEPYFYDESSYEGELRRRGRESKEPQQRTRYPIHSEEGSGWNKVIDIPPWNEFDPSLD